MTSSPTSPEITLLLALARVEIDGTKASEVRVLLHRQIDWIALLALARRHEMVPLLHRHLSTEFAEAVPAEVRSELRQYSQRVAFGNLARAAELAKIVSLGDAGGIQVLAYKGPTLAAMAYENLTLREFIDLDFLIPRRQLLDTWALLRTYGYQPPHQLSPYQEEARIRNLGELQLRSSSGILIEIHTSLLPRDFPYPFDLDRLWRDNESIMIAGRRVITFPCEDLLLFLCAHGAKHCWSSLKWICDVAEIIRVRTDLDWDRLMELADRARCTRAVHLGLALAAGLLDAAIPANLQPAIQADRVIDSLGKQVKRELFRRPGPGQGVRLPSLSFHLRVRERALDGARYALSIVFRPTRAEWAQLALPPWLAFLYYPYRILRHLLKGIQRLIGKDGSA